MTGQVTANYPNILNRPGIWILFMRGSYTFMEVLPNGTVQQLNPEDFTHDGELSHEGFNWSNLMVAYGPFDRKWIETRYHNPDVQPKG